MYLTSDDGSQNMSVYQTKLSVLEFKKDKVTEYVTGCKSKGAYISKIIALHNAFLPNIKYF